MYVSKYVNIVADASNVAQEQLKGHNTFLDKCFCENTHTHSQKKAQRKRRFD